MNNDAARGLVKHTALVAAIASAFWWFAVRPLQASVAEVRDRVDAQQRFVRVGENQIAALPVAPAIAAEQASRRASAFDAWCSPQAATRLYDLFEELAADAGIRLERVEPRRVTKAAHEHKRDPSRDPDAPAVQRESYVIHATGRFEQAAAFIDSLRTDAGIARVEFFRLTPTGLANQLAVEINVSRYRLDKPVHPAHPAPTPAATH